MPPSSCILSRSSRGELLDSLGRRRHYVRIEPISKLAPRLLDWRIADEQRHVDGRESDAHADGTATFGKRARKEELVLAKAAGRRPDRVLGGAKLGGGVRVDTAVRAGQVPGA